MFTRLGCAAAYSLADKIHVVFQGLVRLARDRSDGIGQHFAVAVSAQQLHLPFQGGGPRGSRIAIGQQEEMGAVASMRAQGAIEEAGKAFVVGRLRHRFHGGLLVISWFFGLSGCLPAYPLASIFDRLTAVLPAAEAECGQRPRQHRGNMCDDSTDHVGQDHAGKGRAMDAETLTTISQQLAALAEGLRDGNLAGTPQAATSADLPVRLIHTRADLLKSFDSMIDRAVHSIRCIRPR